MKKQALSKSLTKAAKLSWTRRPEILLCHRIPQPLYGVNPRSILGPKWWEATRQKAYASTAFHCLACGVWKHAARYRRWLEAHEVYKIDYKKGRMTYVETVPLCHMCHNFIHMGRLEALLERGELTHKKFSDIVIHGQQVLDEAGLKPLTPYAGPIADWGDWRLIIGRKHHRPKFNSQEEWLAAHPVEE